VRAIGVAGFDRVVMNVIAQAFEFFFIADRMFPKLMLPNSAMGFADPGGSGDRSILPGRRYIHTGTGVVNLKTKIKRKKVEPPRPRAEPPLRGQDRQGKREKEIYFN